MKRIGRPPLDPDSPSVNVNVRMPARDYDRLHNLARQARVSVPELVRFILQVRGAGTAGETDHEDE